MTCLYIFLYFDQAWNIIQEKVFKYDHYQGSHQLLQDGTKRKFCISQTLIYMVYGNLQNLKQVIFNLNKRFTSSKLLLVVWEYTQIIVRTVFFVFCFMLQLCLTSLSKFSHNNKNISFDRKRNKEHQCFAIKYIRLLCIKFCVLNNPDDTIPILILTYHAHLILIFLY